MPTPKENLDMRLASGEISLEEYEKILAVIEKNSPPLSAAAAPQSILKPVVYEKPKKLKYLHLFYIMLGVLPFSLAANVMYQRLSNIPLTYGGDVIIFFLLLMLTLNIVYIVFFAKFVYRIWNAMCSLIPDPSNPSPVKAVGFMFIPFFNLYWIFVIFKGFWTKLNPLLNENEKFKKYRLSFNPGQVMCIALIVCGVLTTICSILKTARTSLFIHTFADFIYTSASLISLLVPVIFVLVTGWVFEDIIKEANAKDDYEN